MRFKRWKGFRNSWGHSQPEIKFQLFLSFFIFFALSFDLMEFLTPLDDIYSSRYILTPEGVLALEEAQLRNL